MSPMIAEIPVVDHYADMIRERQRRGLDTPDEVWGGRYIVMPDPGNEHQDFVTFLTGVLFQIVVLPKLGRVHCGCNITDQSTDWTQNYRRPDVAVFLNDNPAEDRGSHWFGGPDLAIEVLSRGDRAHEKVAFYFAVGVQELVLIERAPWRLEYYVRGENALELDTTLQPSDEILTTHTIPCRWQLQETTGEDRPLLVLTDGEQTWSV